MGLDTLNIELPGGNGNNKGGAYKGIVPGNYIAKINKFELWKRDYYKPEENAMFLVLKLETLKPSDDFEGYPIDDNNPEGPKYEGLIGNVKTSTFAFKDGFNTRINAHITRDEEILKALLGFCTELDCVQWFRDAHGKYDTIEEWVDAFNTAKPFEGKYLEFCVAGEQYVSREGKNKTTLHLPKLEKVDGVWNLPYKSLVSQKPLIQYNEETHFKKPYSEPVENFKGSDADVDIKPIDLDLEGFDIL